MRVGGSRTQQSRKLVDQVEDAGRAKALDWVGEGEECSRSGDLGCTGGGESGLAQAGRQEDGGGDGGN